MLAFLLMGMFPITSHYMQRKLLKAIETGDYEKVESLLPYVFDFEGLPYFSILCALSQNYFRTPLQLACEIGDFEMVKALIEEGADVNGVNKHAPFTPLMLAVTSLSEENLEIADYLIQKGAIVSYRKKSYDADALYQLMNSREKVPNVSALIDLLVENGGDISYYHESEGTLLNMASYRGNEEIIEHLLMNYSIDPSVGVDGKTALIDYCRNPQNNSINIVKLFLEKGVKNAKDDFGKTAYDYAVDNGNMEIAELLNE